jgi:hypothetical protein
MEILPYLKFDVALWPLRKKLDHLNACLGTMAARHSKGDVVVVVVVVVGRGIWSDRGEECAAAHWFWIFL